MPANIYNANWFANNLVRKYPLDSMSSCIDMYGNYLPDNIITDIQIAFPTSVGYYCYISAVNITEKLISIVINAGSDTIAALCVARPITEGRFYNLDSLHDGVSGIITLGVSPSQDTGKWVFNNSVDSRILPTCCSPYTPSTILSLSRPSDSSPLTGNVLLTSGNDIELKTDKVYIDGKQKTVIFIGLDLTTDKEEVLSKYLSTCDVSTEMNNCSRPYVASIGGAIPDCSGNIQIDSDSSGSIEIEAGEGNGIIILKSNKTLNNVCRNSSPFSINETGEGSNECPYPTERSDDICPNRNDNAPKDCTYPPDSSTFTAVDLYDSSLRLSESSAGGVVYGECSGKSVAPADEGKHSIFYLDITPTSKLQLAIYFSELSDNKPSGIFSVSVGNDKITIANGTITYIVDGGTITSSSVSLTNVQSIIIMYSSTSLDLYFNNTTTHIADIADGVNGTITVSMQGSVCLEGVRYV